MEKILLPIWEGIEDIWIIVHTMQLTKRVGGKLFILEVRGSTRYQSEEKKGNGNILFRIRSMDPKQREVSWEYFQVKGDFFTEIIKFIKKEGIDTVVLELPQKGSRQSPDSILDLVNRLKSQYNCKIELVRKSSKQKIKRW